VAYAALRLSTHIASATFNYQQLEFDQQVGRLARRASNSQSYFTCTQRPVNDFEGATRESSKFRGFMSPLTSFGAKPQSWKIPPIPSSWRALKSRRSRLPDAYPLARTDMRVILESR
jgi:hypothetical protein